MFLHVPCIHNLSRTFIMKRGYILSEAFVVVVVIVVVDFARKCEDHVVLFFDLFIK